MDNAMENTCRCEMCRETFRREDLFEFDDTLLCEDCLTDHTLICERCGERIWADDNAGDEHITLCQTCFDNYYTRCCRCGDVIREVTACYPDDDFDRPMCEDCYDDYRPTQIINDYYYKPVPIFHGDGSRYFGVELEIDEGGECNNAARKILEIANANGENRLYCKHDGSLDDGFELVSHPMTPDYHKLDMPWREMMSAAKEMGYTSHQARTCGLHVHVNRTSFGKTVEDQEECIARVLYFFEKFWDELLKFSRRTRRQVEQWASRYGLKEEPKEILDHAKKGCRGLRYVCVNLCPTETLEFRIFRGTLKYNSFIATLELVNRICDIAMNLTDEELKNMSWTDFVSGCTEPELIQYLKERRLYVNDPVISEEEV